MNKDRAPDSVAGEAAEETAGEAAQETAGEAVGEAVGRAAVSAGDQDTGDVAGYPDSTWTLGGGDVR